MEIDGTQILARTITDEENAILAAWLVLLKNGGSLQTGRIREAELQTQAILVLGQLRDALASGQADIATESYASLRETLGEISRSRAIQGFTSTDTAKFVFSLKEPIFAALGRTQAGDATVIATTTSSATHLLDELGLHTMEVFQTSREEVIGRQSQEIAEQRWLGKSAQRV